MAENSKIEWTTHTFNAWRGCTKVAAGCANCYAESLSKRNPGTLGIWGPNGTRVMAAEAAWKEPLKWNQQAELANKMNAQHFPGMPAERPRVFCASLADVFEDWQGEIRDHKGGILHRCRAGHVHSLDAVFAHGAECQSGCNRAANPMDLNDVRARLFKLIDATPNLDWLLLTKRPENIRRMWLCPQHKCFDGTCDTCSSVNDNQFNKYRRRDNAWLGTSIACRDDLGNIEKLRQCRDLATVLFLSIEPLIEDLGTLDLAGIDWVIVGGESGHGARQCRPEWVRSIVKQCKAAGVPCFTKQLGQNVVTRNDMIEDHFNSLDTGWPDPNVEHHINGFREDYQGADCRIQLRDKKGGDWNEWPEDLRVREFPAMTTVGQ